MDVISLIQLAKEKAASDVHLIVSSPPLLRIDGSLSPANGLAPLTVDDIRLALTQISTPDELEQFRLNRELDFGYTLTDGNRVRGNAAMQRGSISVALRLLAPRVPTIDELGLPSICKELALKSRGLMVVTGPTGSGKTTTMAAMIHHLNTHETRHIVTIEDPIEYVHLNLQCAITQREVHTDTRSFADALKHVLRQDPDVILVGEMRDTETAAAVLTIAETGHLILTTGHAPSTAQAMERIIDLFPPSERHLVQMRLASLLLGALCQSLVPRADGSGRVVVVEVMLANPAVRNLIREGKMYQLANVIRTHRELGMVLLDEALVSLYLRGLITSETVIGYCNDHQEVEKLIDRVEIKQGDW